MYLITADTDYAVRALVHLCRSGSRTSTRSLAAAQDIPVDFAYKVMRRLTAAGLTTRLMGAKGGFTLARASSQISLLDIVRAAQGDIAIRKCCSSPECCSKISSCTVYPRLMTLQSSLVKSLGSVNLVDIVASKRQPPKKSPIKSRRAHGPG
jgi:Rrf2 family protein